MHALKKFTDVRILNLEINKILKKYGNTKSLYIIIIIGIVFMLFSGIPKSQEDNKAQNHDAYTDEVRLKEILSKIDGVGEVHVMVTYYGTTTSDIAFEKKQNISHSSWVCMTNAEGLGFSSIRQ